MAEKTEGLVYRKRPLRRVGKMIYYGSMADSHIILMQIKETKREQDMEIATKVSVELQRRPEEPRPGGQAQREGQPVRRYGRLRHLAGAGPGRKVRRLPPPGGTDRTLHQ